MSTNRVLNSAEHFEGLFSNLDDNAPRERTLRKTVQCVQDRSKPRFGRRTRKGFSLRELAASMNPGLLAKLPKGGGHG